MNYHDTWQGVAQVANQIIGAIANKPNSQLPVYVQAAAPNQMNQMINDSSFVILLIVLIGILVLV